MEDNVIDAAECAEGTVFADGDGLYVLRGLELVGYGRSRSEPEGLVSDEASWTVPPQEDA